MITGFKYAVVNADLSGFAYMDMGEIKFDPKMPRRSGTTWDFSEAKNIKQRFEEAMKRHIEYLRAPYTSSAKVAKARQDEAEKLSRIKFGIVQLHITVMK